MTGPASAAAQELAARIVTLPTDGDSAIRTAVEQALSNNMVLRLSYTDAAGHESNRVVEPAGLLSADGRWYLIAWCRTRRVGRGFRLDRIAAAAPTGEQAQPHNLTELLLGSAAARRNTTYRTGLTHTPAMRIRRHPTRRTQSEQRRDAVSSREQASLPHARSSGHGTGRPKPVQESRIRRSRRSIVTLCQCSAA